MPANRKDLDRWAREFGYNDFDTFVRSGGGSILEARRDITQRIHALHDALTALENYVGRTAEQIAAEADQKAQNQYYADPLIEPEAGPPPPTASPLREAELEPPDTENAHIQGAEDA
jgi:hypothetical protein